MTRAGNVMEFGIPGQADVSGILDGGYRAEIEVKTGSGRLSKEQIAFKTMIEVWGGFYFECREMEALKSSITHFLKNKKDGS